MIEYFSDELTDCSNKSPEKNKTITFLKLFELSVMRIKLFKSLMQRRFWDCTVGKFEKGRLKYRILIKLAIIGTTILVVRRSKTLNKKVP